MKNQKTDNIHHFAHEFAYEDLKDKTGVDRAHHSRPHRTRDGQYAQMKKQTIKQNTGTRTARLNAKQTAILEEFV
mgnify:CR=1 FL=1